MENFKVGDRVILKKKVGCLTEVGDVLTVTSISDRVAYFRSEDGKRELMLDINTARNSFEKYEEPKEEKASRFVQKHYTRVIPEKVDWLIGQSDIEVQTLFGNCTMVALRLPNGFVIVETSACVDPNNYDIEIGKDICMSKIRAKVFELEGYKLCNDRWFELDEYDDSDENECYWCDAWDCELNPNYKRM